MRLGVLLLTSGGLALAVWLVLASDLGAVLGAFLAVGWGLAAVVLVHAGIIALCGTAWLALLRRLVPVSPGPFLLVRWIREAVNVLLPVAGVGGDILGARLITFWRVPGGLAGASVLVDLLLQAVAQATFTLLGLLLLARHAGTGAAVAWGWSGLGLAALGLSGFYLAQRHRGVAWAERLLASLTVRLARAAGWGTERKGIGLDAGLEAIWHDPGAIARSFLLHFGAWLAGVLETWIALRCMDAPAGLLDAVILESLGQALRGAAFAVPSGLGVQEGGFMLLGGLLGIEPQTALALSLVKRVPEVVLGLPGLLAWHGLEARRSRWGKAWMRRPKPSLPPKLPRPARSTPGMSGTRWKR